MSGKYHAKPTVIDGIRFASRGEANRYCELKLLQQHGTIRDLTLQVRYPLVVNKIKIGTYVADFVYRDGGKWIVEDFKGVRTPIYKLKKKLMLALHRIEITEVAA